MAESRSIIFFADGSQETRTALSRVLLAHREHTLLAVFLERARTALQDELSKVAQVDRYHLPDFQDLHCIYKPWRDESSRHPALHPTEIVLAQLAHFISAYEQRPEEPYPDASTNLIVGICFGELSASAVSLARSLTELLPLAVEAVRTAFKAGIAASKVGNDLERRTYPAGCWSVAISRDYGLISQNDLDTTCRQIGILEHLWPHITSLSRKTTTLGGPPSSLKRLLSYLDDHFPNLSKGSRREVGIYAPYHAPRLFSRQDACKILENSPSLLEVFHTTHSSAQVRRHLGAGTGRLYYTQSRYELLENVVYNIMGQPIRWQDVLDGCKVYVEESGISNWTVRPFGQTAAARSLAATLTTTTSGVQITFDDFFGSTISEKPVSKRFPIAIVGMAGRFPNAEDPDALWEVLKEGLDCHTEIPSDRFNASTHLSKPAYGCFLSQPGLFDARFFNMSPREALQTDPGQRLALVTAYEALEMSGFVPNRTPSTRLERIGTFNGQVADEYKEQNMAQDVGTYFIPGSMRAFGPGRINHFFKFGGPAFSFDTACSTSSVALHVACNSIWSRECDTAVVGGMNIISSSDNYVGLSAGYFLSPTGGCKTWDDGADGYCRGEAVASVVIKPLAAAQADNDNILSVILSTATNYSAEAESITRPHGPTQERLYSQVLEEAGITAFDVSYIEMHGTGTQAGDSVEMSSVSNVFAPSSPCRPAEKPLYIGAVKANVGHGESASGVTGLIKTLLILREQAIPQHVGIKGVINRAFPDLKSRNLHIPFQMTPFPCRDPNAPKRRIILNNFSAAGGNTVCALEEPPIRIDCGGKPDLRPHHAIALSAKSKGSLSRNIANLLTWINKQSKLWSEGSSSSQRFLSNLSYTTTARRIQHPIRLVLVHDNVDTLRRSLQARFHQTEQEFTPGKRAKNICFVFTGQGSLYTGLGKELFQMSDQFRSDMVRFDRWSRSHGFDTFLPVIEKHDSALDSFTVTQLHLAMVAVQMGLCRLFKSWGVRPNLVMGSSLGEYAALYASGVLSANDTLYLVGQRASLLQKHCTINTHAMLALKTTEEKAREILGQDYDSLEIACINGPEDIIMSGPAELAKAAVATLKSQSFKCTLLKVPFAFHSAQMDTILNAFEESASKVSFMKPEIPIMSPLLKKAIRDVGIVGPNYLKNHTRRCVNMHQAILRCESENLMDVNDIWLEIGPHPVCLEMIRSTLIAKQRTASSLEKNQNAWTTICRALAYLHEWGCDIAWNEYHRDFESSQRLLEIPTYSFEEKNYWIKYENDWLLNKKGNQNRAQATSQPAELGPKTTTVQRLLSEQIVGHTLTMSFETNLADPKMHSVITGHIINGQGLCPASVYADIALTIANYIRSNHSVQVSSTGMDVHDVEIIHPILVTREALATDQILRISAEADLKHGTVKIEYSTPALSTSKHVLNARCMVHYKDKERWSQKWSRTAYLIEKRIHDLERGVKEGTTHKLYRGMAYKLFSTLVEYDHRFQGMQEVLINTEQLEAVATLKLYSANDAGSFFCCPFWIDSFMQISGFVMNANDTLESRDAVFISHGWGSMRLAQDIDPTKVYRVHVKMQVLHGSIFAGDASIFDGDTMIGLVKSLKFQQVPRSVLDTLLPSPKSSFSQQKSRIPDKARAPLQMAPLRQMPTPDKGQDLPIAAPLHQSLVPVITKTLASPPPPVKDDIGTDILNIIADETGVSCSELSEDAQFQEIGVDSLSSLAILSRLREELQLDLPQTFFQDYPTVGELRRHFSSSNSNSSSERGGSDPKMTPASSTSEPPVPSDHALDSGLSDQIGTFRHIVAEQIGVRVEELLGAEDLSQFGIDSLMSLSIAGALREQLGISAPQNVFTEGNSMQAIEEMLIASVSQEQQSQSSVAAPPRPVQSTSLLLQGNPASARKIIFLFPDGSGSAVSYAKLPEISKDICVFGLNSPFLRAGPGASFSVEDISESWVAAIRSRQPTGPYILGGWSAGGYYAFVASQMLRNAGEVVEKLILIDTPPRNVYEAIPLHTLNYLAANNIMGGSDNAPTPRWLVEHFELSLKAIDEYKPTEMSGPRVPQTFIIWASEGVLEDVGDRGPDLDLSTKVSRFLLQKKPNFGPHGWEKLLPTSKISIAKAPGSHFTMVHPPNVETLSRLIAAAVSEGVDASQPYIQYNN